MSAIDYTKAYITHNNGTSLGTIDQNNNIEDLGTFVDGNGDALTMVYGLAFGKDGEIYLTQQQGGSNEDLGGSSDTQIWKANLPAVGGNVTLTKIGTGLGLYRDIAIDTHAMDIGPDGSMYILDLSGNIFTVDLSTGLASFVAETVINGADPANADIKNSMDIVFDANFTLYAQGTHPDNTKRLFTVNASTGAATSVGTFSDPLIMGLWANSDDIIYATKYSSSGNLYTVDPETAVLTLVGNEGDYGNKPHGGDAYIAYSGWTGSDPPTSSSATPSQNSFTFKDGIIEFGDTNNSVFSQKNVRLRMMGGNDYIEIVGGVNNFINGNNGSDQIVLKAGQGTYQGGAGKDTFTVIGASNNYINGNKGPDKITLNAGLSKALGGDDNDSIEVLGATIGSWVNGNNGNDLITGVVAGVTYRGGSDDDVLAVSRGDVWGDNGSDTFQATAGAGVAFIQDYTTGLDKIRAVAGGGFTLTDQGLAYGVGGDQMLMLLGINDASQVTVI